MRVVTIVSLAASAVLGLGALVVAKTVLPGAGAARSATAPKEDGVPVVVASRAIKYGDKLEPGMLTIVRAPANLAPEGAFATLEQVLAADKGGPPVALAPIAAREPVLPTRISGPGSRPTVSAEVAEGMRAYTLKVSDATGVGGHALPGDRVDVVLVRDLTPTGHDRNYISYVVVQNARVLGIDLNADPTSQKPASPNTVTIEVSVEESQKLSIAATLGNLSLALRRNGEAEVADASPLRTGDFLVGGGRPARTSSGGGGPVRAAAPAGILIVEGEAVKRDRKPRRAETVATSAAQPAAT
ncbi:Flp pilus assembly protein CpaB [Phenylobacterium sp.]|uniref:Flp pilus assembly protein CpaB n=1 Tax=Phenylobacterium sp. TaxID=1871053 RepID=UPI002811CDE2|nr:Flp pilus assembly protein CpaB [Phenylobacterium sp.]